jgi:hypothetical protein
MGHHVECRAVRQLDAAILGRNETGALSDTIGTFA